jgi:lysophospholipase L1-like esterase
MLDKFAHDRSSPLARLLASLTLVLACSENAPQNPGPQGGSGSGGKMQGSGGLAGAGAGGAGAGSGGLSGGGTAQAGGSAGSGGASGAGGAGAGAGGAGAGGAAGTVNGGGMSGGAGAAGGNAAGSAGAGGAGASGEGGAGGASAGASGQSGASGNAGSAGAGGNAAYQPCPATGPCKIMPFGDSITEGFPVNGGYRSELFRLEHMAGNDITFVGSANNNSPAMVDGVTFPRDHEGHGGFTISGNNGIAQFVNPTISGDQPHIVILKIGTNDINGNVDVQNAPMRLGNLIDSIFTADPDLLVILVQIIPTRSAGTNQAIQTYNAAMPALVTARQNMGRHILLVDMYTEFTSTPNYQNELLGDNLHPNQAGYTRMAEVFFDVLEPYIP